MKATATHKKRTISGREPNARMWASGAFLVWIAALVVVFFLNRSDDVGHMREVLFTFPGAFGRFQASALRDSVLGLSVGGLALIAWFGFGDLVQKSLDRTFGAPQQRASRASSVAVRLAWGAGLTSLLMFLLGMLRSYLSAVGALVLVFGLLLAGFALRKLRAPTAHPSEEASSQTSILAIFVIAIPVVLAAIASLAPPVAKDTLLYHISLPKAFLAARGIVDVPYNTAQFYALGAELNGLWAMLVGQIINTRVAEAAFGFTQFAYLPILLLFVYGWMRSRSLPRFQSLVPVALIACVPTVYHSSSSGYNDCALALYITMAVAAAARWWKSPDGRSGAEIGLAIGFALCVKLLALFVVAALAILFLFRLRLAEHGEDAGIRPLLRSGLVALLLGTAIASPWYLRNYVRTGSPVFPFYMNIFHGHATGWDEQRSMLDQMLNSRYGGYPKSAFDCATVPFRVSLTAQPEFPQHFDGVLGISFLACLPLVLVAAFRKRLGAELGIAAALAGTYYLAWVFTSEQLRYLLPALPALAVAVSACELSLDRRLRTLLLCTAIPGLVVALTWFAQQNPLPVVVGTESRNAYLDRNLDHYKIYETANSTLPLDSRLWLINMRRDSYYLERAYFSDFRIEDFTLVQVLNASSSAQDLRERVRQMGITHILYRSDTLLDPRVSPVIDERRPPAENELRFGMMRNLLVESKVLKVDGNFVLVQLN